MITKSTVSLFAAGVVLFALAGCNTPRENVAEAEAALTTVAIADAEVLRKPERREIEWDEAVDLLMHRNPTLREARAAVTNADAQIERVWLDLLPVTSVSYSIERALETIVKGGGRGDGTLSVFSFLNIPGVMGLRMRYYSAVLSKVRVEYAYQNVVREQHVALWRLWRDYGRFRERKAWAAYTRRLVNYGMDFTGAELNAYLSDYALEREEQGLQSRLGQLFGTMRYRWELKGTVPSVDYDAGGVDLADTGKCGLLQLRLAACELEGARLRVLGAHLVFWPDIGGGASSPPLYQSSNGIESKWNWKDVSLYANLNWNIDTRLAGLYTLAETKRQVALMRDRLLFANQLRLRSLLDAKRALQVQTKQVTQVERRLGILRTAPIPVGMEQFSTFASELRSLIEQRASLSAERDALNSLFWVQDETRWPHFDPDALHASDKGVDEESKQRLFGKTAKITTTINTVKNL